MQNEIMRGTAKDTEQLKGQAKDKLQTFVWNQNNESTIVFNYK